MSENPLSPSTIDQMQKPTSAFAGSFLQKKRFERPEKALEKIIHAGGQIRRCRLSDPIFSCRLSRSESRFCSHSSPGYPQIHVIGTIPEMCQTVSNSAIPSQRSAVGEAALRDARADHPRPRQRRLYQPVSHPGAKSFLGLEIGDEDLLKCCQPVPFCAMSAQRAVAGCTYPFCERMLNRFWA
jgi:hypothetical protein